MVSPYATRFFGRPLSFPFFFAALRFAALRDVRNMALYQGMTSVVP